VALENINLWHERDISHSSAERIILPDRSILLDYLLTQFLKVLKELVIYPQNMLVNILKTKGLIFSQRVLLKLMEKGMIRTEAYEIVKNLAMKSYEENKDFKSLLQNELSLKKYLSKEDIEDCFSVDYYLRNVDKIFKRVGID
jgi:adenylosuccinate lyase